MGAPLQYPRAGDSRVENSGVESPLCRGGARETPARYRFSIMPRVGDESRKPTDEYSL